MALLTLKDIGKIYVSEGNVAVGIRGVTLSFDRGEFVAVTGKSGSGKSTLLNVISGMDSYEEGELTIEGQTTSHYLQPEWEEYREKYISFIFQDYNIIESFTVLQNVELALMHIEDKKMRRERALELIRRVGLASHVKQKGSKLSGGQKQRTVIARALAKDSPIILADEPTGNLDSQTSKEIIELLREVSKDKLLIVVTHNFEEVADHATRHIRIFDGSVESDHVIRESSSEAEAKASVTEKKKTKKEEAKRQINNGITLGKTIFTAKPKLSTFLCLLMLVGTLGVFMVTTLCGSANEALEPNYMFNHIDGRLVLTKQNGEVITEDEIKELAQKYGAESYLRFDALLDEGYGYGVVFPVEHGHRYTAFDMTYGKDYGKNIIGRYPKAANEVFLYLPIYFQDVVGKDKIEFENINMGFMDLKVTGVKYYYNNNLTPECLFTEEGFRTATALHYLRNGDSSILASVETDSSFFNKKFDIGMVIPSFEIADGKIYVDNPEYHALIDRLKKTPVSFDTTVSYKVNYYKFDYYYSDTSESLIFEKTFTSDMQTHIAPPEVQNSNNGSPYYSSQLIASDEVLREVAEGVLDRSYKQASLFFKNDKAAHKAAKELEGSGYIAVPSDTTYEPDAFETITEIIACGALGFVWLMAILFLAFFINLCSTRTLGAFKGDMAIMRSMGISVKTIRIAMYVRMLISLIPAFIFVAITAFVIFLTPSLNEYFVYLYAWQYVLIFLGMLLLTVRITYKQIRKLFRESVKKSLKGGAAE